MAWIALVPLIYGLSGLSPRAAFQLGWFCGTLTHCGLLYWVVVTFHAAHLSSILAVVSLVLLSAYLGLFWGAWSVFLSLIPHRSYTPVAAAAAWAALELIRTRLFSGFPWALLGDSQCSHLDLIQIASITGVYGVSFLVVLINASLAGAVRERVSRRAGFQFGGAIALLLVCGVFGWNHRRSLAMEPPGAFRVALLQGSIDQYEKWDKRYVDEIQRTYEGLNQQAVASKPSLIVWPETSVPGYLLQDPELLAWLSRVVRGTRTWHIVGAPSLVGNESAYNSAYSLTPEARIAGQYDKQHLVPFGEVVPWGGVLGRWIRVLNELGGFRAGVRSPVVPSAIGPLGLNICYEAIFPNLVRQSALQGAGVLVNLTNDGWYMRTAAPYQHFVPNIFRAVENARYVIRADNTGISAIIDPAGRVQAASPIFMPTIVTGTVSPRSALTFYTRFGDVFAALCLAFCIAVSLRAILRR